MNYSKEFQTLLDCHPNGYIGHGNPNSKILFIGQEPAIDCRNNREQYVLEIADNAEQWRNIVANGIGYDSIDPSKIEFGSPLHPWANQKFQVRSVMNTGEIRGEEGTAKTWYNYQKLINRILELYSKDRKPMNKNDHLDLHRLSFHTDMSDAAYTKHSESIDGKQSVIERVSLLSADFFRNFPIVIAAVGHFPRDTYGNSYFGDIFGVEFLGNEETELYNWMNVSVRNDDAHPMLLIHTPQFSDAISDIYIEQIAKRIVDFAKEHNIKLLPEE
ncbi:MAG: hypothetical protein HDS60_03105 [Barnesiella sp.]|nr:hypothetical protein [Barnesiella sp.]